LTPEKSTESPLTDAYQRARWRDHRGQRAKTKLRADIDISPTGQVHTLADVRQLVTCCRFEGTDFQLPRLRFHPTTFERRLLTGAQSPHTIRAHHGPDHTVHDLKLAEMP
jgi:hypothetical protein